MEPYGVDSESIDSCHQMAPWLHTMQFLSSFIAKLHHRIANISS